MLRSIIAKPVFVFFVIASVVAAGCQQPNVPTSTSATTTKSVAIEIGGMSCEKGCAPRAREALETLPWVKDVKVDFAQKQGTFTADPARYDEAAILAALEKEGFSGRIVK